jgi:hypothetical protein
MRPFLKDPSSPSFRRRRRRNEGEEGDTVGRSRPSLPNSFTCQASWQGSFST